MPITLSVESQRAVGQMAAAPVPPRKKWTRAECELLDQHSLLHGERYELIEGELISKMGMNRPHSVFLGLLIAALMEVFGKYRVQSQVPMDVSPEDNPTSEPQPDVLVLTRHMTDIMDANPRPEDILLVAEVADSSIEFDRTVKARLYARACIADYWVLDINQRQLIVHRDPVNGAYTTVNAYSAQESVTPLASPDSPIAVSAMLP